MSVNKVILIGNVGKDPDVRYLDTGIAVATFSLATTDRAYTLQNGTQVPERTEWHNIVLWRGLAQTAEKYVRKGDKLYIEGKIRSRSYDDQNGIKRTIVEIFADNMEMLTPRNTSQQPGGIIVVDFIDMNLAENRQKLYERMCQNMQKDRAKHNILPLSKFGLMQITRQRVRPAMDVNTNETCPTCFGKGSIKPSILFTDTLESKIDYLVNKLKIKRFTLYIHPYIAAYVNQGLVSLKRKWQMKYGFGIKIIPDQSLAFLQYRFTDVHGEEIDMKEEIEIK